MKLISSLLILSIFLVTFSLAAPQQKDTKHKKTCTPGSKWREECHSCYCTEDGKVSCSKEACPPQLVPRNRRDTKKTACKEGEHWKEACHSCHCANGSPACTRELCESEAPGRVVVLPPSEEPDSKKTKREEPCEEGKVWKEDCHTCFCSKGHKACTRELCFSESPFTVAGPEDAKRTKRDDEDTDDDKESDEDEKCPPNKKEWMEDCNKCYCGTDGLKVCGRALCPDGDGPVVAIPVS